MFIARPKKKSEKEISYEFEKKKTLFGLPFEVKFCKKCIISNQRPNSETEYKHNNNTEKKTIKFSEDGVCDACIVAEKKKDEIDWKKRENELWNLCDKFRSKNSEYDCIVPGSGGKDSFFTSHILKYKFGMNPLTVTWAPHMYTTWGIKNMENWVNSGFDNYLVSPNRKIQRLLTRLAVENLFHPFQPFQFGQKILAPKLAKKFNINLIFYGENQAEYGNDSNDLKTSLMQNKFYSTEKIDKDKIFISGVSLRTLKKDFGLTDQDLYNYIPLLKKEIESSKIEVHFLSHYLKWHPQSNYYYAVKHGGFVTSPERMPGTYTKYASIDDKMEDFNYYTLGIKYGLGWTSYIASWEVRDGDITREEALSLCKKYDLEFPKRFSEDFYKYISLPEEEYKSISKIFEQPLVDHSYFMDLHDKFRSPHLWKKTGKNWELRHTSWNDAKRSNILNIDQETSAQNWQGNK